MPDANSIFAQWANYLLIWVGFGTLVGLIAKAILPGKDPGGAFATVVIGVLGSVIGAGVLVCFSDNLRVTPISPIGFVVAVAGTSMLLCSYRLLNSGKFKFAMPGRGMWKRGARRVTVVEEK